MTCVRTLRVPDVRFPRSAVELGKHLTDLTLRSDGEGINALDLILARPNTLCQPSPSDLGAAEEDVECGQGWNGRLLALSANEGRLAGEGHGAELDQRLALLSPGQALRFLSYILPG